MRLILVEFLMVPFVLLAQREPLLVNGMEMSYEIRNDSIAINLTAPTRGWVGIGFNSEDNIVGSDLLLFHVVNGHTEEKDMYVKGFGDPREDVDLNGQSSFLILKGREHANETQIQFQISLNNQDALDYRHELSKSFWLILA